MLALPHCRAEWLWDEQTPDPRPTRTSCDGAILYLHGGAFIAGGLNTHRRMVAKLARASRLPALHVGYRQLPRAHVTDSLDDAMDAYRYLLDQGFSARRLIVSGDSAGGGLALRLVLAVRDAGLPMPAGVSVIAPWADFDWTARNAHPNARRDDYLPAFGAEAVARRSIAVAGRLDPSWSPVNHDFAGMPPILIQVGSTECLLPDAEAVARRAAEANVPVRLQIWPHAPHVHQIGSDVLPDAAAALADMAQFHRDLLRDTVAANPAAA
jgi:acetyl esterase/lipase